MTTRTVKDSEIILDDLLRLLVQRWGYSRVSARLSVIKPNKEGTDKSQSESGDGSKRHRLTASDYVKRANFPPNKQRLLSQLAKKFDNREFLPSVGHVREFLGRRDVHGDPPRGRSAALAKIFGLLSNLSEEDLDTLLQDESHSGPSRLGPLSDAIKQRAAALRFSK